MIHLPDAMLVRMARNHGCETVVEEDVDGNRRLRPLVTTPGGSLRLGRPRPIPAGPSLPAALAESSVVVIRGASIDPGRVELLGSAALGVALEPGPPDDLAETLVGMGLKPELTGWARAVGGSTAAVALCRSGAMETVGEPPAEFTVTAIMSAYNEVDLIVPSIAALVGQGVHVHLVDNWSTDGTPEEARRAFPDGRLTVERFPAGGPTGVYQWGLYLDRVAEIAGEGGADWFIHHDADELRQGPWPGIGLRRALYRVQREGYNAIDHTVIDFPPMDESFEPGRDFGAHFTRFAPPDTLANRIQIKAWKAGPVDLRSSGGHEAAFPERRVHPLNFLLRHYPIRSQAHGERKVLGERRARFDPAERASAWHMHYDHVRQGHRFHRDPEELIAFDEDFDRAWLLERLYGFPTVGHGQAPGWLHSAGVQALRMAGLSERARSVRRWVRIARGRHPDTGRA